jgi:hypothetical protein
MVYDKFVTLEDFASYWETTADQLPKEFKQYFTILDTEYRDADKNDLENYISSFIEQVSKPTATRTVEENIAIFEQGWSEHKALLEESGISLETFIPKYYNSTRLHRGPGGKVYVSKHGGFPVKFQILYIRYITLSYLRQFNSVHEFGSGSGLNLFVIASTVPGKNITGYEWTKAGVDIANLIGDKTGWPVNGRHFDMFTPPPPLFNLEKSAVLTCGSIEQLGDNYNAFLDFVLESKPGIVIHLEPDGFPENLSSVYDRLSKFYIKLRGYSQRFSTRLKELENTKEIEILFSRFIPWMSNFYDVKCTIWKPQRSL